MQQPECAFVRFYGECTKTLKTLFRAVFMRVSRMFALLSRSAKDGLGMWFHRQCGFK